MTYIFHISDLFFAFYYNFLYVINFLFKLSGNFIDWEEVWYSVIFTLLLLVLIVFIFHLSRKVSLGLRLAAYNLRKQIFFLLTRALFILPFIIMLFSIFHNITNYCMLLDLEKIKDLFIELLTNKLYINECGNLFSESVNPEGGSNAQSETDSQDSVSEPDDSDQAPPQDNGDTSTASSESGDAADSISSAGGADSDSYVEGRDYATCVHVSDPNAPPSTCAHDNIRASWHISEHHDRCHECSLTGAGTKCCACHCLFHSECIPTLSNYNPHASDSDLTSTDSDLPANDSDSNDNDEEE